MNNEIHETPNLDDELLDLADRCEHDPLLFVEEAFDWGHGDLKGKRIKPWQRERLISIRDKLSNLEETNFAAILEAVVSGNGIGKSALVSWLIIWAMATKENTCGIVTANTEHQLKTKTWSELAKWHRLSVFDSWFKLTATALFSVNKKYEKTWRVDMVPWSEEKPEAFSGMHNEGSRILMIFDESSGIPDVIWDFTEGGLTDKNTEIIWTVFGNATRSNGRFRECFRQNRKRWTCTEIDSRDVEGINLDQVQKWKEDHGVDSDFFKMRVRGMFPSSSNNQFLTTKAIDLSMSRPLNSGKGMPLIMSMDAARGGDDRVIFRFRRGLDARSIPPVIYTGEQMKDSMLLAAVTRVLIEKHHPDAVFLDVGCMGGPIVDRVRQYGYECEGINFSGKSPDPLYANMRAYMYFKLSEWLDDGGCLEENSGLRLELESTDYLPEKDRLQLLPKEVIKKLIGMSPDDADATALLHAMPVRFKKKRRAGRQSSIAADMQTGY